MRRFFKLILSIGLVSLLSSCATTPTHVQMTPGSSLQEICSHYNIQWQFDNVTQVVTLEYKNNKAKALVGSAVVLLGTNKITLNSPLRRIKSTIYVPDDFESKVIGTFGATKFVTGTSVAHSNLRIRTIVLDPGHGGKDPGAKGFGGIKEKDVNLDIAKRVKPLLEGAGLKVIMTRDSDTFPSLEQRTQIASDNDVDFFVSIHANSMPSRRTQGVELYYVKTQNKKDLDEEQRTKNEKSFLKKMNKESNPNLLAIVSDMMYQQKVAESGRMAMRLVHDLSDDLNTPNRGARHCRYFVVRNTLQPAVLIETGFLTNKYEEKKLGSSEYRQKAAESIARSIIAYASS